MQNAAAYEAGNWTQPGKLCALLSVPCGGVGMRVPSSAFLEEQDLIVSSLPPSRVQRRLAVAVVLILAASFVVIAGPLSTVRPPETRAFIPAYATAMFVNESITAALLFAQFSIVRSRALLAIASGYLFSALTVIVWMLTFPGVFAQDGLLKAGLQTPTGLYISWHAAFPVSVIMYGLLKDADPARRSWRGSTGAPIVLSIAATASAVGIIAFILIAGEPVIPHFVMPDKIHYSAAWYYAAAVLGLLSVAALVVLWIHRRSMFDLWLMVVISAYLTDICLNTYPDPSRYTLGWYVCRICQVFAASIVLFVLMYEITKLYAQLLRALIAQRREREARLMTGDTVAAAIAHEVNQPLAAMITRAETGLRWLEGSAPNLDKLRDGIKNIAAEGHRAAAIIEGIRAGFKKEVRVRTSIDVNGLIGEALALVRDDLQKHRILFEAEPNARLPQVIGDRIQLQQVLLNLITNAIDSMAATDGPRVLRVKSQIRDDGAVVVSIADTGAGISAQAVDRLFNPLFTTKAGGMGMGLSICRSIIEAHDGQLSFVPNHSRGAVFQLSLRPAQ
jgi:signal transduction histidine kinase